MKTLYESILDDENILMNNANNNITAAAIYNKIICKEQLTKTDIDWINNNVGVYKVNRNELEKFIKIVSHYNYIYNKLNLNWLDVSQIEDMSYLFNCSEFNGDISKWDVSNVKDMRWMFYDSKFNGDISKWDVSNVRNMDTMFQDSKFNGDISKWDVRKVEDMKWMFCCSKFNRDISKWNVSNVRNMRGMFQDSQFNRDISKWDVSNVEDMNDIFYNCPIKDKYIPKNYENAIRIDIR